MHVLVTMSYSITLPKTALAEAGEGLVSDAPWACPRVYPTRWDQTKKKRKIRDQKQGQGGKDGRKQLVGIGMDEIEQNIYNHICYIVRALGWPSLRASLFLSPLAFLFPRNSVLLLVWFCALTAGGSKPHHFSVAFEPFRKTIFQAAK